MDLESLINICYSVHNERQETLKTSTDNLEWQKESLHFYRNQIEPYVFHYLIHHYGHKLDEFWKTHQFPKKNKYAFVIVERRIHPNWWFILRNIAWAAPHFSLYIFCSDTNYDFIKSILGNKIDNVHICKWFKGYSDRQNAFLEYNISYKMPAFYKLIDAEYFINVQMDSYFIQKIPDWIFTGIYYGSPWGWNHIMAGNGGLSVRNVKHMINICEKYIYDIKNDDAEDWYFSKIINNHYKVPPFEFRIKVFQENFPTEYTPIGTHQFWTYINNYNLNDINYFTDNIKKLITIIGI
jgi:hypothetical protein